MVTYGLRLYDLAGTLLADGAPFQRAGVSWELDGPGALEVTLRKRDVEPVQPPLGSLVAWYDAASLSGYADGALVGTWPDRSGNGRDATQGSDAAKPTYLTSGIAGRPSLRFDGIGKRLTMTLPALGRVTLAVVGRYAGGAFVQNTSFLGPTGSPSVTLRTDPNDQVAPHALRAQHNDAAEGIDGRVTSPDQFEDLSPFLAVVTWDGNTLALRLSGDLVGQEATVDQTALSSAWRIGFPSGSAVSLDLAEILVYSDIPDLAPLERYLASRWGLGAPEQVWAPCRRRVELLRDGTAVWGGWLLGLDAASTAGEGTTYTARALGYAAPLKRRVVLGDFSRVSEVATTIAWSLVQHAQAQPNGDFGIALGTVVGTAPALTRHWCDTDGILEAIDELASRSPGGFDWEVDAARKLNMWVGGRGTDKTGLITFSRDHVREMTVTFDGSELATYAHAVGADPDGPCGPAMVTEASADAANLIRQDAVVDADTSDAGELQAKAEHELAIRSRSRLRVEVVLEESHDPKGLTQLQLGDSVTAVLPGAFGGSTPVRLISRQASLESRGVHFWTLTFEVAA